MKMDPGIDTGPILRQQRVEILPEDTAGTLSDRLAETGAALLVETLPGYLSGEITPQEQDESQATYAAMISKEEGLLDFNETAEALERRVRAFQPWPGAFLSWQNVMLKVYQAHVEPCLSPTPGKRYLLGNLPAIGTAQDCLALDEVQPAGKKPMSGQDFLRGARQWEE